MTQIPERYKQVLEERISTHGFTSFREEILDCATEYYCVQAIEKESYSSVGNCRIFGKPDFPSTEVWPHFEGASQGYYGEFLCQINFSEIPKLECKQLFPESGILYLFWFDYYPGMESIRGVYYDGDPKNLVPAFKPDDRKFCVDPLNPIGYKSQFVPAGIDVDGFRKSWQAYIDRRVDDDQIDIKEEYALIDKFGELGIGFDGIKHYPGGLSLCFPESIGDNLRLAAAVAAAGYKELSYWDIDRTEECISRYPNKQEHKKIVDWFKPRRQAILDDIEEWVLLLRLSSSSIFTIGDAESIHVLVRKSDMKRCDFSQLYYKIAP